MRQVMTDIDCFSRVMAAPQSLRGYQREAAVPLAECIINGGGEQFAIVFSRQAGKDEMLAQLLAFLLLRRATEGGSIVVVAPTLTPQALISRDRLLERMRGTPLGAHLTERDGASIVRVRNAKAVFLSAAPTANVRGQTADIALIANETQDISPARWDAVFDPMAASTNAPTVFMGTVWTRSTLLARQMRYLRERERDDGVKRVFLVPWDRVAKDVPDYGDRVRSRIAQLGATHPFIRTEYFLEELDNEAGMFPPERVAQMQGEHPRQRRATPGRAYAMLIDIAGGDEKATGHIDTTMDPDARRDSTALTVVEVQLPARRDALASYRVVDRRAWTGKRHAELQQQLLDLALHVWHASWIVIDATGIGHGLTSLLASALEAKPIKVEGFQFTAPGKSELGWGWLGLIESGRYKEYARDDDPVTNEFWRQVHATEMIVRDGPSSLMKFSVPAGSGHDDLVMSAALVAHLDTLDLRSRTARGSG